MPLSDCTRRGDIHLSDVIVGGQQDHATDVVVGDQATLMDVCGSRAPEGYHHQPLTRSIGVSDAFSRSICWSVGRLARAAGNNRRSPRGSSPVTMSSRKKRSDLSESHE